LTVGESIASSAVKTSIDIGAKLIIVMSETGKMARYVAKFRPGKYESTWESGNV
jgi:pyruvate kinase